MTANPIPQTIVRDTLNSLRSTVPGVETLLKQEKLSEKIMTSLVSGLGDKAINDYLADVTLVDQQVRGRSKTGNEKPKFEEEEVPTMDPVARPNGDIYYPRPWGDKFDVGVLRLARETEKYVLVQGDPGTGKTVLGEAAYGDDMYTVMISGDTEVSELVGQWVPKAEGGFMWVDGPLVKAAEEGKVIFLDEIGLADPKVLSVLYSLMDGRQELMITQNPLRGIVKAVKGFFVYAATNPHAPGVKLSEALLSRFAIHAEITTDYEMAMRLGVSKKIVGAAQNMAKRKADRFIDWAPQMRDLLAFRDLSKIYGDKFAYENMIASAPERDRQIVKEVLTLVSGEKELNSAKV